MVMFFYFLTTVFCKMSHPTNPPTSPKTDDLFSLIDSCNCFCKLFIISFLKITNGYLQFGQAFLKESVTGTSLV